MADPDVSLRSAVERLIEEMRMIARVAGQYSVEGPEDVHSLMAAAEAERAARWADALVSAADTIGACEDALRSIAANSCCAPCQEAKLVAAKALGLAIVRAPQPAQEEQ